MPLLLTEVPLVQVFAYPTSSVARDAGCDVHPDGVVLTGNCYHVIPTHYIIKVPDEIQVSVSNSCGDKLTL
jgi:hypothetical protein